MNTNIFISVIIYTLLFQSSCTSKGSVSTHEIEESSNLQKSDLMFINNDSTLHNIEQRILKSFIVSQTLKDLTELKKIKTELISLQNKKANSIVTYWISYAYYYEAVYWIVSKNNKESEQACQKGTEALVKINKKSSEHYALLSLLQNFSVQFLKGFKVAKVSAEAKKNGQKALDMDENNLRAFYVLALNDFYTPESFGGGKFTEKYTKKAIELDAQFMKNPYMPSWGKSLAYELLIRHYLKIEDKEKAKKIYKEAVQKYPDDYLINKLSVQLID